MVPANLREYVILLWIIVAEVVQVVLHRNLMTSHLEGVDSMDFESLCNITDDDLLSASVQVL